MSIEPEKLLITFRELVARYNLVITINPETFHINSPAAVDVEHDEAGTLVGIGVYDGTNAYYFTETAPLEACLPTVDIIAHNGKTDMELLRFWGIPVTDSQLVWDTELIGHILDSSRKAYGLKKLALEDCEIEYPSYDDIVGKRTEKQKAERVTLDKHSVELVSMYCVMDCYAAYKIYEKQKPGNEREWDYFNDVEKPVAQILQKMENRGVRVDLAYLNTIKAQLEAQRSPLEASILNELGPINLNSPKQLLEALHAKDIYPEFRNKASTDKRALDRLATSHPVVSSLLKYSELDTLLSSFVYAYLERGQEYVHPYFNQCGTRTGRLSCSNPNLLQIPQRTKNGKLVRRMFIPRDGMLMGDCDFGQIEPRVLAHFSKDPALCQLFAEGTDFHDFTAERLQIDRDRAKVLNLSVGYRATSKSVSQQLKCEEQEAQYEINKWWSLFPTLRRWQETEIYQAKRSGFCTTLLGRRIPVEGLEERNHWKREAAERQLINNITQGSAAELMKLAMIRVNSVAPELGLLVQVYDELLFESPNAEEALETVKSCMVSAYDTLLVPLTVDGGVGANWEEAKA